MKRSIHTETARLGLAISSPIRLKTLNLLSQRPWRVSELAGELGQSLAATSAHLKVLRSAHMVSVQKSGRDVWCKVASSEIIGLLDAAQKAAEALLPEFREVARKSDDDPFVLLETDFKTLAEDVADGTTILIDLRPAKEFEAGHIPHAQSWPYDSLSEAEFIPLEGKASIVGYCRGPWCRKARLGVEALNQRGIPAKRLRAGVVEWQAAGFTLSSPTQNP